MSRIFVLSYEIKTMYKKTIYYLCIYEDKSISRGKCEMVVSTSLFNSC